MLGKSVAIQGKGYIRISLTKEETEKHMEELLEFNIKELTRIIVATKNSTIVAISQTDAIKLLFEKQGIASYTWLQAKVDEKIEKAKSGNP
jgi:hypothetical protein